MPSVKYVGYTNLCTYIYIYIEPSTVYIFCRIVFIIYPSCFHSLSLSSRRHELLANSTVLCTAHNLILQNNNKNYAVYIIILFKVLWVSPCRRRGDGYCMDDL